MVTPRRLSVSICLLAVLIPSYATALSLQQAEQIALQDDPAVAVFSARADAHQQQSIAAQTLPDPQLRLGVFNLPTDTFDIEQEPSTQLRLGVQQMFPRGDSREIGAQQQKLKAEATRQLAEDARLRLLRDVRVAFLNLYYETQATSIIRDSRALFKQLVSITQDRYASGRANQQDVIRASLELSRLDDRYTRILGMQDQYRAELMQWLGDYAQQDLDETFPALPELPALDDPDSLITRHPLIRAEHAAVDAEKKHVDMAKQEYSPGVSAFVEYRERFGENMDGSDRSDMLAAMVTMDIPLFTGDRQDRNVAASEGRVNAARYALDDRLRGLKQQLDRYLAAYQRAEQRELHYRNTLLDTAKDNSRAALNAYQSGVSEFTGLMRAQMTELDVRLEALRIQVDKAIAQARLLYVSGEQ